MLLALVAAMLVQAPPAPHRVLIRDVTIVSLERKVPLQHRGSEGGQVTGSTIRLSRPRYARRLRVCLGAGRAAA